MDRLCLPLAVCGLLSTALWAAELVTLTGRVTDSSGAVLRGAAILLAHRAAGTSFHAATSQDGSFRITAPAGEYLLKISADGFAEQRRLIRLNAGEQQPEVAITLQPATLAQEVQVYGNQLVGSEEAARDVPGSIATIDALTLARSRVFNLDEALRKAPGVYARPEEGFSLRPNIGIRGLNPTRSSKVLLLEDGVPISYAPYGDNASYYHPPVDRFEEIEILKGSGQILYGPSTVGGVINYLTPPPPDRSSGSLTLTGGNLDYLNGHVRYGNTWENTGFLLDYMRKQGDGARANTHFGLNDVTAKVFRPLSASQTLAVKLNHYGEGSQLTYSGLRLDEWLQNPRANPFINDALDFKRVGGAVTHTAALRPDTVLTTNFYGQHFHRDWWRQSSNSAQRPNNAANPLCGGMANLNTTCGNEGRLRDYITLGLEPKLRSLGTWLGRPTQLDAGFRAHFENQDRQQRNGDFPTARTGRLVEDNVRKAQAYSAFLQNRFLFGRLAVTPGLRMESVHYRRTNRLAGVSGRTNFTEWIPGLGLSYTAAPGLAVFAGVHRGFAPPRVEDIINNTTGGVVELDSELSWNYEAGVRARLRRLAAFEATYFRLDFQNQIVPASVAGGIGTTLTSAGETLHQGAELSGRADWSNMFGSRHSSYVRAAYTWLPVARYVGTRFSSIPGAGHIRVTGNRLPYAPEHLVNASLGYAHSSGANALIEAVTTSGHFADDLNTWESSADGQRGRIPGYVIWNFTANYPMEQWRSTVFFTIKNLTDRLYIADRTRGLLPGMPRLVQLGLRFSF